MSGKTATPKSKKASTKKESTDLVVQEAADFATDGPAIRDVDVADIKPIKNEDSHILLTGESWVILGEAEDVPEWAVGKPAAVISSPVSRKFDDEGNLLYEYTRPNAKIQVRERSQGVLFTVPLDSAQQVSVVGGRPMVANFG